MPIPARGRPRKFDTDKILDRAICVFADRGYAGTSVTDLTIRTSVTQGSLYKAFKDKRTLFMASLERYKTVRRARLGNALGDSGTGLERLRRLLYFYAASSAGEEGRNGCLVVRSLKDLGVLDEEMSCELLSITRYNEATLVGLLQDGQADGSVSAEIDVIAAASFLLCLTQGMRVIGKTGREGLEATVDLALKSLV